MTENERKSIKWIKNVRDDAVITLDYIQKNEPNVSPMLYAGRKQKAETIVEMCEELEQYRAIGTVEKIKEELERLRNDNECQGLYFTLEERKELAKQSRELSEYKEIGTIEEFKALKEKNKQKKVAYQDEHEKCPACGSFHVFGKHCTECGQAIDWNE